MIGLVGVCRVWYWWPLLSCLPATSLSCGLLSGSCEMFITDLHSVVLVGFAKEM